MLAVGGGEFEYFTFEPQLAELRGDAILGAAGRRAMVVEALREGRACDRGDLGDEALGFLAGGPSQRSNDCSSAICSQSGKTVRGRGRR